MKHISIIQEYLEREVHEYSAYNNYEIHFIEEYEGKEHYEVEFKDDNLNSVRFRVNDDIIEVETNEDCWEQCEYYNYNVKYFWIALLQK